MFSVLSNLLNGIICNSTIANNGSIFQTYCPVVFHFFLEGFHVKIHESPYTIVSKFLLPILNYTKREKDPLPLH